MWLTKLKRHVLHTQYKEEYKVLKKQVTSSKYIRVGCTPESGLQSQEKFTLIGNRQGIITSYVKTRGNRIILENSTYTHTVQL